MNPSTMFFRRASPPFYLSYFYSIYFPPVDLLLSVLRCSSFRTLDIPYSPILPWTHPITCCLVASWTCAPSSLAPVLLRVVKYPSCWRIAACLMLEMILALLFIHFNYCLTTKIEVSKQRHRWVIYKVGFRPPTCVP